MDRESALKGVFEVFEDVMDVDPSELSEDSTGDDVEEWDSLSHVRLVVAIERKFDTRFSNSEIEAIKSVRDIIDNIMKKASA
ncbi:MAG: acyl carrier protein [Paracoccaceae bacterium]|jgi:acyl carrier protein|nr:acyl carrier protein [Paracoccaceae bacterium]MDH5530633.1 acyl carrier protein [Paracoccaceae bacterium]